MPPVSLPSGLSFQCFLLEGSQAPRKGRGWGGGIGHRADGDFHCRSATTSALNELPAQEPIRKGGDKERNHRSGNSTARHCPMLQPRLSSPEI